MTQTPHFVIWICTLRFYILELRVRVPYDKTLDTKCVVRAEGSHAWFSSGENPGERPLFEADFISQGHHQLYRYLYQLELRKNTLQNVALILFHGVSPNPLAPKVMVPKLTSRQRMFAYKADQIHRGEDHTSFRMNTGITQVLALFEGVPFFGRHCMPHFCRGELPRNRHNVRCVTWQMVCLHKYAHLP